MHKLSQPKSKQDSALMQPLFSVVIPIVILVRFSNEAQLGATRAFLLALAFPVAYEVYSFLTRKKLSYLSVLAIGGIVVTGLIGFLGLSEGWLAVRRAAPYAAIASALLISMAVRRPIVPALLPGIIDMETVKNNAGKKHSLDKLDRLINRTAYLLCALLFIIALISYVLTRSIIMSATNTAEFNQEFARLRLLSIPALIVPLFIGLGLIVFYLIRSIEKLTGLDFETILKKK